MLKNVRFALLFIFIPLLAHSQTNVRAWYAQGQVWIVWQNTPPLSKTLSVFKKNTPFANTSDAVPIGRLFAYEFMPGTYYAQLNSTDFTYKIPKPDGSYYQLLPGEGLFVETVTATGAAYYAVAQTNQTPVNSNNITSNAVNFTYDPVNGPVNCHLQITKDLATGHKSFWYSMWAMGKLAHWAGRPDFPVMANPLKNGMPSMFIISEALEMDTSNGQKVPMTHWFHGGGMYANQFLANNFKAFNINPEQGISVSHNDDFPVNTTTSEGDSVFTAGRSLWFGWTKGHNPFDETFLVDPGDTVINYTQRRIMWINDWLIRHLNIDPGRVALQGYSMGSGGATGLAKAFPDKFSTVCLFNAGFRSAVDTASIAIVGSVSDNHPTNLRGYNNETIGINEVFDLNTRMSNQRDLPLIRVWVGKNDPNDRMHWGPDMVAQLRKADSLGWGTQIHWDERAHTYPNLGMHWIHDFGPDEQTYRDNLAYQETFRSNQSYPAFHQHRLDGNNNDPGIGTYGINNGDGDNWGTWGGYHNWENVVETSGSWSADVWLESGATFENDNCPADMLKADVTLRKTVSFVLPPGSPFYWKVISLDGSATFQSGTGTVGNEGLVTLPQIEVFKTVSKKLEFW